MMAKGLRLGMMQAALFAGLTGSASAAVTDVRFESFTTDTLSGYVVNDLFISFTGQLTDNQMLTSGLEAGDINQNTQFGADTAPNGAVVNLFPDLAFDTFVNYGAAFSDSAGSITPSFAGGAVDLGGNPGITFNSDKLDAAWFISGGTSILDQSDYFIARITLKDDANGALSFAANAGGLSTFDFQIVNGSVIPEPTSAALLGLVMVPLLVRRRTQRTRAE